MPEEKGLGRVTFAVSKIDKGIGNSVKRVINLTGGLGKKGKVLIKPNVVFAIRPSSGIVTNPDVIEAIVKYMISEGFDPGNITIGESGSMGFDTKRAFRKTGMNSIGKKYDVNMMDLSEGEKTTKSVKINGRVIGLDIAKIVFESDLIINVPVIKTHFQTGMTMAVKNMFGVLGFESRKTVHKYCLDEGIAQLNRVIPNYITIGDASIGLEGFGPSVLGKAGNWGLIFSSKDPVAHDSAVCSLFGVDLPRHVKMASDIGVGVSDLGRIDIVGEDAENLKRKIRPALGNFSPLKNVNAIDGGACAYCLYAVYLVLLRLSTQKIKSEKEIEVLFGRNIDEKACDPKKEKLLCGDCTKMFRDKYGNFLPGCPPKKEDIIRFVKRLLET